MNSKIEKQQEADSLLNPKKRKGDFDMAEYECKVCGWIYSEAEGAEEQGVAPGTKWAAVPDSFECPLCGAGKEDFELK